MDPFPPLTYASAHVNNAVYLMHFVDEVAEYQTFVNDQVASAVRQEIYIPNLGFRLATNLTFLAAIQSSFCAIIFKPEYLQPPLFLLALEVLKKLTELRISLTKMLNDWENKLAQLGLVTSV